MDDYLRPDLATFPDGLEVWTGIDDVRGCRVATLAAYLGCTVGSLESVLPDPIGQYAARGKLYPLWDPQVVFDLVDHTEVVASRRRRSNRMTPLKRSDLVGELIKTWDTSECELVGIVIGEFKSIDKVFVPLDGTTVLLGRNGSGKTNILEAVIGSVGAAAVKDHIREPQPGTEPLDREPYEFGAVYQLKSQNVADFEVFLERYLHRFEEVVADDLRRILEQLFREPLVVAWRDQTIHWRMGGGRTRLAAGVDDPCAWAVSGETLNATANDPWLAELFASFNKASRGIDVVAGLPESLALPEIEVAVVDGDPGRLEDELEDKLEQLMKFDHELPVVLQNVSAERNDQLRFLNDLAPDEEVGIVPEWLPNLGDVERVWVSWMSAPVDLDPVEVAAFARQSDPEVFLAPASGDTEWVAVGIDERTAHNTVEVANITDRGAVRRVLRHSVELWWRWYEARDDTDPQLPWSHWTWRLAGEGLSVKEALGLDLFEESDAPNRGSAWLRHGSAGAVVRPELLDAVRGIESESNKIAPPFVGNQGRIVINVLPIAQWMTAGRRLSIRFLSSTGRTLSLESLGRGTQRWIAASVREAVRLVSMRAETSDASGDGDELASSVRLLLVDEPEMALHPDAQDQVAQWCVRAGQGGQRVLIATHSPSMLELSPSEATLVKVSMINGATVVEPFEVAALEGLDRLAESLGLGRGGLLNATRGFVVVEGPADEAVLNGLLRSHLRRQRIVPIPLHGAHKYRALVQPELLMALGKPLAVMFDDVRPEVLARQIDPKRDEEKTLLTLLDRVPSIHPISFDAPDIVAALPDDAVRRVEPSFQGWAKVLEDWEGVKANYKNFKTYVMSLFGRREKDTTPFIHEVLAVSLPGDELPKAFSRSAKEIVAWSESLSSMTTAELWGRS